MIIKYHCGTELSIYVSIWHKNMFDNNYFRTDQESYKYPKKVIEHCWWSVLLLRTENNTTNGHIFDVWRGRRRIWILQYVRNYKSQLF